MHGLLWQPGTRQSRSRGPCSSRALTSPPVPRSRTHWLPSSAAATITRPRLTWSGVPAGVKSFAIVLHDPDAPVPGGFYHWVVYNLPAAARSLKSNPGLPTSELGETSVGKQGYFGPCPPPNSTHHYVFTLYALDIAHVPASPPLTAAQLEHRIAGHIIASAVLRGTASSVEAIP